MKAEDYVMQYFDKLYDSTKYPDLKEFKDGLIKLSFKEIEYLRTKIDAGYSEQFVAVAALNLVGESLQKIMKYDFKVMSVEDYNKFMEV